MDNSNLFQKIIARVGKEHNIQHIILANYNCGKINEIVAETEKLIRYQQQQRFKPKTVESIDDFINNCIYYNESPLNIFCVAFSWRYTSEDYAFWYRLNILYRDYIYRLLFGESYG